MSDPYSGKILQLNASPEVKEGMQGWRIRFPYKFSFFILQQNGQWQVAEDIDIHPDLINQVGKALPPVVLINPLYPIRLK